MPVMYQLTQIAAQLAEITFRSEKTVRTVDERFGDWNYRKNTYQVFSQTFAIKQVHMDRLALSEGTESDHVFVRVERHAMESSGVTKLRVDCNLVTWGDKKADRWSHYAEYCQSCYYRKKKHDSHLCLYSRHMPSHPRYQRK